MGNREFHTCPFFTQVIETTEGKIVGKFCGRFDELYRTGGKPIECRYTSEQSMTSKSGEPGYCSMFPGIYQEGDGTAIYAFQLNHLGDIARGSIGINRTIARIRSIRGIKRFKRRMTLAEFDRIIPMEKQKGLVIIYTGEGKGKTTAALGLILRASGYNKKILLVQFIKNSFSGELELLKKLKGLKIIRGGQGFVGILGDKLSLKEHKKVALGTFKKLEKEIMSDKWDLVIADEIFGAISGKLISSKEVINLISAKPQQIDLILTGWGAPQKIIEVADLVTEMKMIKHPFQKGILAKEGIDY